MRNSAKSSTPQFGLIMKAWHEHKYNLACMQLPAFQGYTCIVICFFPNFYSIFTPYKTVRSKAKLYIILLNLHQ